MPTPTSRRIFCATMTWLAIVGAAARASTMDLSKFQYAEVNGSAGTDDHEIALQLLSYFSQDQVSHALATARVNLDGRYLVHLKNFEPQRAETFVRILRDIVSHRTNLEPTFHLGSESWLGVTDHSPSTILAAMQTWAARSEGGGSPEYPDAFLKDLCEHMIVAPRSN